MATPTPDQLSASGTTMRAALEALAEHLGTPLPAQFNYLYATMSNHLLGLEQADSVPPGFYGSHGALLPEFNPVSGAQVTPS